MNPYYAPGILRTIADAPLIKASVEQVFNTTWKELESKNRTWETHLWPRQIAHYLLRKYTSLGVKDIGITAGRVDHTTVLNSLKIINNELQTTKGSSPLLDYMNKVENNYLQRKSENIF